MTYSPLRVFPHALSLHMRRRKRWYVPTALVFLFFVFVGFFVLLPPSQFPRGEVVVVSEDATFAETASMLEERHIVSSALLFKLFARIGQADRALQAGKYVFSEPVGLTTVLYRLANGISGTPSARVTFPEGYSVREMAETLSTILPDFDSAAFILLAKPHEGYLFPDTYLVPYDSTPEEIIEKMRLTFAVRTAEEEALFASSSRTQSELVIMASLLEKEAKTEEEMRTVAGILWKRIDLGRALQVDAVFGYIKNVDTYHPSGADLDIDSPYNTYKYVGLPAGPIGNPGLTALTAAATPIETDYLYYLTGRDGVMRYARTFEEHKKNRGLYLD